MQIHATFSKYEDRYSDLPSYHTLKNQLSKRLGKYVLNPLVVWQEQTNLIWEAKIVNMQFLQKRLVKKEFNSLLHSKCVPSCSYIKHHRCNSDKLDQTSSEKWYYKWRLCSFLAWRHLSKQIFFLETSTLRSLSTRNPKSKCHFKPIISQDFKGYSQLTNMLRHPQPWNFPAVYSWPISFSE